MAIKVIAQKREVKLGKNPGKKFVMRPDLYIPIQEKKVFSEAATHSGISAGVIKAAWDAAGEVIKAWATEGHSVALPGLGTMRFGLRAKAVEDVNDVKAGLITARRIIFTPAVDLKEELANTAVQITCYDRNGNEVRRVTSTDSGNVEDNDGTNTDGTDSTDNGQNGGGTNTNPTNGTNEGGGTNNGGNNGGGGGNDDDAPLDEG